MDVQAHSTPLPSQSQGAKDVENRFGLDRRDGQFHSYFNKRKPVATFDPFDLPVAAPGIYNLCLPGQECDVILLDRYSGCILEAQVAQDDAVAYWTDDYHRDPDWKGEGWLLVFVPTDPVWGDDKLTFEQVRQLHRLLIQQKQTLSTQPVEARP
jgi:hypothetical protein